jgi:uncharacterized membrane protein YcaP (DUF421 family)
VNSYLQNLGIVLDHCLGITPDGAGLTFFQMSFRAVLVLLWGIILVRIGDRRLLGRNSGFDMLLMVVVGSVLGRAIIGQGAFLPELGACGVMVLLHHLLAVVACHSDAVSRLLKGRPLLLVRNGAIDRQAMRRGRITPDDLEENLRLNGNVCAAAEAREARLERNGSISVVRREEG